MLSQGSERVGGDAKASTRKAAQNENFVITDTVRIIMLASPTWVNRKHSFTLKLLLSQATWLLTLYLGKQELLSNVILHCKLLSLHSALRWH